ncbi:MAG: sulfatase-like hydrolase/transferase [Chrysiogenetes bacterium]|nr:sulfatase-like hydrolase/transferase [Chrysiogenetes bacterium]
MPSPGDNRRPAAMDLLACLSVTNLFFIVPVWHDLLVHPDPYLLRAGVDPRHYVAALALLAALAILATGLVRLARARSPQALGYAVPLLLVLFFARYVDYHPLAPWIGAAACELAGLLPVALVVLAFWKKRKKLMAAARATALIAAPFLVVTVGNATSELQEAPLYQPAPLAPPLVKTCENCPFVFWGILDEWDQQYGLEELPEGIALPNIERLIATSFSAREAYAPAGETYLSLPALLTGKLVKEAHDTSPRELSLTLGDTDGNPAGHAKFSRAPNYFDRMRARGYESALVGFYHPYCRAIAHSLASCFSYAVREVQPELENAHSLSGAMGFWLARLITGAASPEREGKTLWWDGSAAEELEAQLFNVLDNPRYRNVFLHIPLPHPPAPPGDDYFDNLLRVDALVGALRKQLEQSGRWEGAAILLSSDHFWRLAKWCERGPTTRRERSFTGCETDHRVPFVIKLPGQREPFVYDGAFNNVISGALLEAVASGELTTARQVAAWIGAHSTLAKSPYFYGSPVNPWPDSKNGEEH